MGEFALMATCVVCSTKTEKYRCPNCKERYCSLDCWKKHKESGCKRVASPEKELQPLPKKPKKKEEEEQENFKLTEEHFQTIENDAEVREKLKASSELRQWIVKIYNISDEKEAYAELTRLQKNVPEFEAFCDQLLKLLKIRDEEGRYRLSGEKPKA